MSASLVGSEMCIRDRSSPKAWPSYFTTRLRPPRLGCPSTISRGTKYCLLADEMRHGSSHRPPDPAARKKLLT
eukprot:5396270-Alexandrium_andersonii.AAC.1